MKISKPFITLFFTLFLALAWTPAYAQITPKTIPMTMPVEAYRLDKSTLLLTLSLDMAPEWYTYADNPGGMGKPTRLSGSSAAGNAILPRYPVPIVKPDAYDPSVMVNTYKSGTKLFAVVPADAPIFPIKLRIDLLLCHPTRCIPVRRDITYGEQGLDIASLPAAQDQPWWPTYKSLAREDAAPSESTATEITESGYVQWNFTPEYMQPGLEVRSLLSAILMGLLAGLILNIMPCVLPVVSLKLSAILNSTNAESEEERIANFREHNVFFALGILAFFLFLAIILGGTGQAWGALFQKKWLVLTVAGVIFALSLSLFGLFHLPVIDLKFGAESKNPRVKAFFTGNLTTLLATPCSGPFLGGVLSWALVQGPILIATVFISIGIGMSLPYILLIINPSLSRYLPKGGPWIEYVEKGIAFFLVATAFYLVSIALGDTALRILAPLWAILLGGWLWVQTKDSLPSRKWIIRIVCIALFVGLLVWTTPAPVEDSVWEPFDAVELSQRIGKEKLFVDFTADWCPTCKALEATVLTPANIQRWKQKYGVKFIKVDLTERNIEAEALLRALGSMSIPTAALFSPGPDSNSPIVLRDLFTESQLENILKSWKK
ncbi:cytochrome C biogenesis protein [Pseudodesulfovibrio sp. zrk46]|nr:cytochrome C biogenesis protein [Pseudodesulfovibrio sp. zrk46]